jgi:hypothetical protein
MHIRATPATPYVSTAPVPAYSAGSPLYPDTVSSVDVDYRINELSAMNTLAGPNCWGTMAFILGITSSLRYISDIEFNEFLSQCHIVPYKEGQTLPDGAVLCIWNNLQGFVNVNHVSLVVDGGKDKLFEKTGPNADDAFHFTSLTDVLTNAESPTGSRVILVNSLETLTPGKYATLLDISNVKTLPSSQLEEQLSAYHRDGVTLNTSAAPLLIDVYRQEITRITDSRELSLSEGIYQLLQSMSSELNTLQQAYLSTKDKALARQLMSYSALRSMIDSELDHTAAKIHDYRRALNTQMVNVSALTDHHSTLALT